MRATKHATPKPIGFKNPTSTLTVRAECPRCATVFKAQIDAGERRPRPNRDAMKAYVWVMAGEMTEEDAAAKLGVSQGTISRWITQIDENWQ